MRRSARVSGVYTRAERLSDAAVHVTGIVVAFLAAPAVVTLAAVWLDDRALVIAACVYALSLVAMVCCSALYHMTPVQEWKDALRRLDQSAIYLKIAGTCTPFAVMSGPKAMPFLAGLWLAAAVGVGLKLTARGRLFWLTVALYLAMGWAVVLAGEPILERMTPMGYRLVLFGGVLYTVGVLFLVWEQLPFHNTIWHVFVLTASLLLYAAVVIEFAGLAAA